MEVLYLQCYVVLQCCNIYLYNLVVGNDKIAAVRDLYKQQPPMFSMVRDNGQRCIGFPCKCLASFVCCACCQDGMRIYGGGVEDTKGEEGNPNHLPVNNFIASVIQPNFGGWCHPQVDLRKDQDDNSKPFGKVEGKCRKGERDDIRQGMVLPQRDGRLFIIFNFITTAIDPSTLITLNTTLHFVPGPFCFGGCSEFCCDFEFMASKYDSASKTGDLAKITKVRAKGMGTCATYSYPPLLLL